MKHLELTSSLFGTRRSLCNLVTVRIVGYSEGELFNERSLQAMRDLKLLGVFRSPLEQAVIQR